MPRTRDEVLEDIKKHPESHIHNSNGLRACCTIAGYLDLALVSAHREFVNPDGTNGCSVVSGPCCCGGTH